ncbi:MAG TPA: metal-dependent hydrolase [Burkholderiales bacterium]
MDTLTHALSGALLARAVVPQGRAVPRYVAAGFLACAAPDLDFAWTSGGMLAYIEHHRGVTHSLVLLPLWALGLAWLLAKVVPIAARQSENGARIIVPKLVTRSPAMCSASAAAAMP